VNEFFQTLAALKRVEQEAPPGGCASDSAQWAVGDALIEECGVDPVWDADSDGPFAGGTFKGGSKLHEAVDWLEEHGIVIDDWILYSYREMSERFPPGARSMRVTYCAHIMCGTIEEVREFEAQCPEGWLSVTDDDADAYVKYGPA
jgi:hypothetical protein